MARLRCAASLLLLLAAAALTAEGARGAVGGGRGRSRSGDDCRPRAAPHRAPRPSPRPSPRHPDALTHDNVSPSSRSEQVPVVELRSAPLEIVMDASTENKKNGTSDDFVEGAGDVSDALLNGCRMLLLKLVELFTSIVLPALEKILRSIRDHRFTRDVICAAFDNFPVLCD